MTWSYRDLCGDEMEKLTEGMKTPQIWPTATATFILGHASGALLTLETWVCIYQTSQSWKSALAG